MTAPRPTIGLRLSNDRRNVVILFGSEEDTAYYGTFSPEQASAIADDLKKLALSIPQIRPEGTH